MGTNKTHWQCWEKFHFVFLFSIWDSTENGVMPLGHCVWRIHPKFSIYFRLTVVLLFCNIEEILYVLLLTWYQRYVARARNEESRKKYMCIYIFLFLLNLHTWMSVSMNTPRHGHTDTHNSSAFIYLCKDYDSCMCRHPILGKDPSSFTLWEPRTGNKIFRKLKQ